MTFHLPSTLTVGGSSNVDNMSSTHPNLIPSVAKSYMRQKEEIDKNPFWNYRVDLLWPFNFQPKIFKFKYLGFCSSDWKTEDSSGILRSGEDMVKNPFWYFECFTSGNPCDSSTFARANFWPETPEKFSKHGFSFFHPNLPISMESRLGWHFGCLI